jgi:hypothetical protein
MSALIAYVTAEIHHRRRLVREAKEGGYSTETVLVTALLVTLALLVIGTIALKVSGKANSINLG